MFKIILWIFWLKNGRERKNFNAGKFWEKNKYEKGVNSFGRIRERAFLRGCSEEILKVSNRVSAWRKNNLHELSSVFFFYTAEFISPDVAPLPFFISFNLHPSTTLSFEPLYPPTIACLIPNITIASDYHHSLPLPSSTIRPSIKAQTTGNCRETKHSRIVHFIKSQSRGFQGLQIYFPCRQFFDMQFLISCETVRRIETII